MTTLREEERIPLKVYRVKMPCSNCDKGHMQSGNGFSEGAGMYWEHICNNCGFYTNYDIAYPYEEYVEK